MLFDDLKLGMAVETEPVRIEKEKMVAFAKEYDDIPLHTDDAYAKNTPFGQIIAPGVMSFMSVWNNYLKVDFFGDDLIAGKSTKLEWMKPVLAGDVLFGKATITNLVKRSERNGLAEVTIDIFNQNGDLVMTNITEAVVKCRKI
jgi:acyl dehydratase